MRKTVLLLCLLMTACGLKLVKEEKYISTDKFRNEAHSICLASKKFNKLPKQQRENRCKENANKFIKSAESKFREFKADEHNYRLCRSKFSRIEDSDKCFMEQQEKYYQRELAIFKKDYR